MSLQEYPNEFLRDFFEAATRSKGNLTSPWMALGEQQVSAMRIAKYQIGWLSWHYDSILNANPKPVEPKVGRDEFAKLILQAQVYFWTNTVFNTMIQCPMPDHIVSDGLVPYPVTYHTLQTRWEYRSKAVAILKECSPLVRDDSAFEWLLMSEDRSGLDVYTFVSSMSDPQAALILYENFPFRARFPQDFGNLARDLGVYLAMLAFLRSPDKHIEKQGVPRSIRRSVNSPILQDKQVNVVTLRRNIYDHKKVEGGGDSVDWKHRWWVSGHMRKQWHPSKAAHEVTWIAPHLKGPDNKPLLEKVYNVARK